mmetsp:Transcript_574/g.2013  ORF Transcript_574/g.2013 Transcript_574/m.2013 type:complete len:312 (+) Transcript_574:2372-3307(+)
MGRGEDQPAGRGQRPLCRLEPGLLPPELHGGRGKRHHQEDQARKGVEAASLRRVRLRALRPYDRPHGRDWRRQDDAPRRAGQAQDWRRDDGPHSGERQLHRQVLQPPRRLRGADQRLPPHADRARDDPVQRRHAPARVDARLRARPARGRHDQPPRHGAGAAQDGRRPRDGRPLDGAPQEALDCRRARVWTGDFLPGRADNRPRLAGSQARDGDCTRGGQHWRTGDLHHPPAVGRPLLPLRLAAPPAARRPHDLLRPAGREGQDGDLVLREARPLLRPREEPCRLCARVLGRRHRQARGRPRGGLQHPRRL